MQTLLFFVENVSKGVVLVERVELKRVAKQFG